MWLNQATLMQLKRNAGQQKGCRMAAGAEAGGQRGQRGGHCSMDEGRPVRQPGRRTDLGTKGQMAMGNCMEN